jgi:hypothetical protein
MFYNDPRIGMVQGDLHKAEDEDGSWITMNGTHVHMKDGEVDKGPQKVKDHVAGKNAEKAKSAEPKAMPKLQGSEKQIAWADNIRDRRIKTINDLHQINVRRVENDRKDDGGHTPSTDRMLEASERAKADMMDHIASQTDAHEIIETRDRAPYDRMMFSRFSEHYNAIKNGTTPKSFGAQYPKGDREFMPEYD